MLRLHNTWNSQLNGLWGAAFKPRFAMWNGAAMEPQLGALFRCSAGARLWFG